MKLSIFVNHIFNNYSFEQMLDWVAAHRIEAVELGTGNYPFSKFVPLNELLHNRMKQMSYLKQINDRGLFISAFSAQGNPLHPNSQMAREHHQILINTIDLASEMGVPIVNSFSGQPGEPGCGKYPNEPSFDWPQEYPELVNIQWEKVIIPYWKEVARYAESKKVLIAIEMHPGFAVNSPATLLKLRHAVSPIIGACVDASHLWPQGIDPVAAIHILASEGALFFFETKDMEFFPENMNYYGLTDIQPTSNIKTRSWTYRTIGYGHDVKTWANIISALARWGYDYVFSIEQSDPIIEGLEGASKAARLINDWLIRNTK